MRFFFFFVVFILCAPALPALAADMYQQVASRQAEQDKELRNSLELTVEPIKREHKIDEPIMVKVSWKNVSDKTITSDDTHIRIVNFTIKNSYGRQILPYSLGLAVPFETIVIKPGKTYRKKMSVNGCEQLKETEGYKCFHLGPGEYSIGIDESESVYYANVTANFSVTVWD